MERSRRLLRLGLPGRRLPGRGERGRGRPSRASRASRVSRASRASRARGWPRGLRAAPGRRGALRLRLALRRGLRAPGDRRRRGLASLGRTSRASRGTSRASLLADWRFWDGRLRRGSGRLLLLGLPTSGRRSRLCGRSARSRRGDRPLVGLPGLMLSRLGLSCESLPGCLGRSFQYVSFSGASRGPLGTLESRLSARSARSARSGFLLPSSHASLPSQVGRDGFKRSTSRSCAPPRSQLRLSRLPSRPLLRSLGSLPDSPLPCQELSRLETNLPLASVRSARPSCRPPLRPAPSSG